MLWNSQIFIYTVLICSAYCLWIFDYSFVGFCSGRRFSATKETQKIPEVEKMTVHLAFETAGF
jgi:hypothetical protein